jgi:hypothetical protein
MTPAEIKRNRMLRFLLWFNVAFAIVILAFAFTTLWNTRFSLPRPSPSIIQKITETQDIEALRKAALIIARSDDKIVQGFNESFSKVLDSASGIVRMMVIILVVNAAFLFICLRSADGRPIRWLEWR